MSNYWNDNLIDDSWLNGGSTPPVGNAESLIR